MAGTGGLSIANNLLANAVQLDLNRNQAQLQRSADRLSSGLRINTAADDPSGLAVAETLEAQVAGFDRASRNVQDASNAATVAEGALQTTTAILQRIRTLAVEAANDVMSSSDRTDLQAEVAQLLLEVNRISQNASFNGIALLDGSHAGFVAAIPPSLTVSNAVISGSEIPVVADGDFDSPQIPNDTAVYAPTGTPWQFSAGAGIIDGNNPPGFAPPVPTPTGPSGQMAWLNVDGESMSQTISGFGSGGQYQLTFQAGEDLGAAAGGLTILVDGQVIDQVSPPPNQQWQTFTTPPFSTTDGPHTIEFVDTSGGAFSMYLQDISLQQVSPPTSPTMTQLLIASAVAANVNFATSLGGTAGLGGVGTTDGSIEVQVVDTGSSIAAIASYFDTASGLSSVAPTLFAPGATITSFDNVAVTLGNFDSQAVGLYGYIKVGQAVAAVDDPDAPALQIQSGAAEGTTILVGLPATNAATLRVSSINLTLSSASNPSFAAEDAIGQLDIALGLLLQERAQLGAVSVRLNEDADNDQSASLNLQSSESAIRDLNVAAEAAEFNQRQILVQVGTSVAAQANANAQSVLRLFP